MASAAGLHNLVMRSIGDLNPYHGCSSGRNTFQLFAYKQTDAIEGVPT